MKLKTIVAAAALAVGSLAASAAQTTPVFVSGSFSDVLLGQITLGGTSNVGGSATYAPTFSIFGMNVAAPAVSFSSVSLYLGNVLSGSSSGTSFSFANLAAGTYSLKASGSVAGGQGNFIAAEYQVSAVPEPETFAMLLAGLGVMGAIARRRKVTAA